MQTIRRVARQHIARGFGPALLVLVMAAPSAQPDAPTGVEAVAAKLEEMSRDLGALAVELREEIDAERKRRAARGPDQGEGGAGGRNPDSPSDA